VAKRRAFQRYTRVLSSRPPSFVVRFAVEWAMRRASSSLRTLPDFLIVGAQRAGTTSLYNYLAAHPAVVPALKKETLFFANYYYRGTGWYRAHFPLSSQARDGRDLRQAQHVTGEASPYYLFHPLAPARAARTVPDAHIIAILRNPVERAYSHYHHEVEMGFETLSFEEAIEHEEERLSGEEARLLRDDRYSSLTYQNYSYLARGIYVDQLVRWVRCFCIEQVLVLSSKDLEQDPERVLAAVARFVGLPALRLGGHRRDHERRYPAMEAKTREHLHAYFAPHNRRLYDFLGADLAWES
jgi:hypothetical protein